jgi:plastocyanin
MRLLPVVVLLALPASAQAESLSVKATSGNEFTPAALTAAPGDSVTFSNGGGFHNVTWVEGTFDDGSKASPADPAFNWPANPTRTFSTAGTYRYYCEQHGTPSGGGMAGSVTVGVSAPGGADTTAPSLTNVRAGVRRGTAGVRFRLSEAADVRARLLRRVPGADKIHAEKNQDIEVEGVARIAFGKLKLKRGRYYVLVWARDAAGNRSPTARSGFRVD